MTDAERIYPVLLTAPYRNPHAHIGMGIGDSGAYANSLEEWFDMTGDLGEWNYFPIGDMWHFYQGKPGVHSDHHRVSKPHPADVREMVPLMLEELRYRLKIEGSEKHLEFKIEDDNRINAILFDPDRAGGEENIDLLNI